MAMTDDRPVLRLRDQESGEVLESRTYPEPSALLASSYRLPDAATGADNYFAGRLADDEYLAAYKAAQAAIAKLSGR